MKALAIPGELLQTIRMSDKELQQEIAVMLFQKEKLTLGQAARFSGMSQLQFQHLLASRQIPVHYDVEEFEEETPEPDTKFRDDEFYDYSDMDDAGSMFGD